MMVDDLRSAIHSDSHKSLRRLVQVMVAEEKIVDHDKPLGDTCGLGC